MSPALKRPIKIHGELLHPWRGKNPPNFTESKTPQAQPALNGTPSCSPRCPRAPISTWHLTDGTCDFLFYRAVLGIPHHLQSTPWTWSEAIRRIAGVLCTVVVEWLIRSVPPTKIHSYRTECNSRTWNCLSLHHLAHPLDPTKTKYSNKSVFFKISNTKFHHDTIPPWSKNGFILHFKEQRDSLCNRSWELTNSTITNYRSATIHRAWEIKQLIDIAVRVQNCYKKQRKTEIISKQFCYLKNNQVSEKDKPNPNWPLYQGKYDAHSSNGLSQSAALPCQRHWASVITASVPTTPAWCYDP